MHPTMPDSGRGRAAPSPFTARTAAAFAVLIALLAAGCGSGDEASPPATARSAEQAASSAAAPKAPAAAAPSTPDDLDTAIVLPLAQFTSGMKPGAARLEFLVRRGGEWKMVYVEDAESNVFHKAMTYQHGGETRLLTVAGSKATVKLWSKDADGRLSAETIWTKDFGGKTSRMRDVEVGDLYGDGRPTMAVATHDQGVVATIHPRGVELAQGFEVKELGRQENTFVHEIEVGDVSGDGVLEVYATPSEPNRLDGSVQRGEVVRYVPKAGQGPEVVADLGDRHAKEIYVDDLDGDGTDELYVVVEGRKKKGSSRLDYGVEIRRFDAGSDPSEGQLIATIQDQLCRFLTAADVDGDGKKELITASFSQGVFLLRPGSTPEESWRVESIDRNSGGFEHATVAADLDRDGKDEIYVASDKHKQVRRYVWNGSKLVREIIYRRSDDRSVFTWNLMPVPVSLVPAKSQPAS